MALQTILKGPKADTVVWGTGNIYDEGVIVDSADEEALVIEEKIENNDGFTAVLVLLHDGTSRKITFVFETDQTPPAIGDEITIEEVEGYVVTGRSKAAKRKAALMMTIEAKLYYGLATETVGGGS